MSCPTCGNTWTLGPSPTETKLSAEVARLRVALDAADRDIGEGLRDMTSWRIMRAYTTIRAALGK